MIGFTCIAFAFCFAWSAAVEKVPEGGDTPAALPEDAARRELTDTGYVIRYNDELYGYPLRVSSVAIRNRPSEANPGDTNTIETEKEDQRRPLFYFTTWESAENRGRRQLPDSRPFVEIRRKRDLVGTEVPESSKVGKLRQKRTYCGRCGHGGGYGKTYAVPVTYSVYPVYYGGGGGGRGCNTCGGGYGGGGGGGSYSYSSSSSHSSAGSFGWGK